MEIEPQPGIKTFHEFSYFTGAHPKIRNHCRAGQRPTEFGNKVWPTSLILMDHLRQTPDLTSGLRVLEIGCGWGILGVFLAKTQGALVTCSDLDPKVLPIVSLHAELNGVEVATSALSFSDINSEFLKNFDVIVGAEVCYSEAVSKDLLQLMDRAFKAGVQRILIADPGRPDFEDQLMLCREFCDVELSKLPGTVNGKVTHLLSASAAGRYLI